MNDTPTHLIISVPGISPMERQAIQAEADEWLRNGGVLVIPHHATAMSIPAGAIGEVVVKPADGETAAGYGMVEWEKYTVTEMPK